MVFSKDQIIQFITDLIIEPRKKAATWSRITKQTASLRIGYPGQHLASLVTGVEGEKTGARGNDLADGSEVKSCSRVDQLDKCKDCDMPVLRQEQKCGLCGSENLDRRNDSKWLFTIRNKDDLNTLLNDPHVNRIILIIDDYPNFGQGDYSDIRIRVFEIWPKKIRHTRFGQIMTNYYHKIYLIHKKLNQDKTPAPKNFWPDQYQFYLCNPIQTFSAKIKDAYGENPKLDILKWIEPHVDRDTINSVIMPSLILKKVEFEILLKNAKRTELCKNLVKDVSFDDFKKAMSQNWSAPLEVLI